MLAVNQIHDKIVEIIKRRGPSLPIQIAKEMNISSLFISAFLSELVDEKRIKMSHLKVGGTSLYYIQGQESQLENFHKFLHPKEAEAFLLLKENKILKDSEQEPAVRVALKSIKDFAIPFNKNNEIYWKYLSIPSAEAELLIKKQPIRITESAKIEPLQEIQTKIQEEIIPKPIEQTKEESSDLKKSELAIQKPKKQRIKKETIKEQKEIEFENPLVEKPKEKPKKEKPKSEFVLKVIEFLNKHKYKIIEEKDYKAKEYLLITQINFDLGPINFLTQAKDKKIISDVDLKKLLSESQRVPLPALILYTGNLSKKAQEYLEKYPSILKAKKIE